MSKTKSRNSEYILYAKQRKCIMFRVLKDGHVLRTKVFFKEFCDIINQSGDHLENNLIKFGYNTRYES
jgi:hypothetical protein